MTIEKNIFISDLMHNQETDLSVLVMSRKTGQTSRGSQYLNLMLADKTGQMSGKVWENADFLAPFLPEGRVVRVWGLVELYKSSLQMVINKAEPLKEGEFSWLDYLRSAKKPPEEMKKELLALVDGLADKDIRQLVQAVLGHPKLSWFWLAPAAKSFHHGYIAGLLEHSLSVASLARQVSAHYGAMLNADLLVAGAILHDLGKCWEFTDGPVTDYTSAGRLLGHLAMGAIFLAEVVASLPGFPEKKLMLLQHCILSHHGDYSMGSPQKPKLLEAIALHALDDLDAKLNGVYDFINHEMSSKSEAEAWTGYNRLLESHYMRTPCYIHEQSGDELTVFPSNEDAEQEPLQLEPNHNDFSHIDLNHGELDDEVEIAPHNVVEDVPVVFSPAEQEEGLSNKPSNDYGLNTKQLDKTDVECSVSETGSSDSLPLSSVVDGRLF